MEDKDLSLTLPRGTVTWEARNSYSTIDLVFMTSELAERLEHCKSREDIGQSSDHIPILTRLRLSSEILPPVRRRAFKFLNMDKLQEAAQITPSSLELRSHDDIETYTESVQAYLQNIIEAAVPWARPTPESKPFWNEQCNNATRATRALGRIWTRSRNQADWETYMHSNDKKHKIIKKAKTLYFRAQISQVASSSSGVWQLAKWARTKSQAPKEVPKMPPLTFNGHTANTFTEKADVLKKTFFPAPPEADLRDLENYIYPPAKDCPIRITKQKVLTAIRRPKADKAPGPDGIPNRLLQACADKLSDILAPLFQACVEQSYHPRAFKIANTIVMKKPLGRADYSIPKGYRPIALFNTLGKALESIMVEKLTYLADTFNLLPDTQMGARQNRSTESALELLTEQVHTVWGQGGDKVATLLSMDVSGAFNSVSHQKLIHNLRKRKIPVDC